MTNRDRLWDVAVEQFGYVTSKDAKELGIPVVELGKLAHRGRLERVGYGIYRFPELPATEFDTYKLATLWPDGRGVLSHETALALYGLCDVNPKRIHLTVPKGFWPRARGGDLYVVHHVDLQPNQIGWFEQIPTVRPRTAVEQAVEGAVPTYLARQAIDAARRRGLVTSDEGAAFTERLERSA